LNIWNLQQFALWVKEQLSRARYESESTLLQPILPLITKTVFVIFLQICETALLSCKHHQLRNVNRTL